MVALQSILAWLAFAFVHSEVYPVMLYTETLAVTQSCSSANALAKNFVVSISNDTPVRGENVTTTFDFDLDVPVFGGTVKYDVSLNGLPYSTQANLCEETAKTNDPCPLAVGHHHQVSIASNTVTGKLITTITWQTEAGAEILCAKITTKTA